MKIARRAKDVAHVTEIGKQMLCPSCDWFWNFEEDGMVCPFCSGAIGVPTEDDPQEAHEATSEVQEA